MKNKIKKVILCNKSSNFNLYSSIQLNSVFFYGYNFSMINYKSYSFANKESSKEFLTWCFENKLYKSTRVLFSHLKYLYTGLYERDQISAIVAYDDKRPIGICICEHTKEVVESANIGEYIRNNWKKEKEFNWKFYNLGFLNMYVKPNYRKKGIAQQLVTIMEAMRVSQVIDENKEQWIPFFIGRELAHDIINNKCHYAYAIKSEKEDKNYPLELMQLTKNIEKIDSIQDFQRKKSVHAFDGNIVFEPTTVFHHKSKLRAI